MSRLNRIVLAVFVVLATTAWFLTGTVLADALPDAFVVATGALGALAFAFLVSPTSVTAVRSLSPVSLAISAGAGALMGFVAPIAVVTNRLTDAPPGSEVLFFTTAAWALIAILLSAALSWSSRSPAYIVFACIGVLGTATLVANWERPSSFSPLIRYPQQEYWFLIAGLAWAVGSILLARVRAEGDRRTPLVVAAASAALVASVYAVAAGALPSASELSAGMVALVVSAVAFGIVFAGWAQLIQPPGSIETAAALWFLPAVAVTGLGIVEQAITPRGPDPVIWLGALGAAALIGVAVAGEFAVSAGPPNAAMHGPIDSRPVALAALAAGALAALLGVVTLALPAIEGAVSGQLTSGQAYNVTWFLSGAETAGGWAAALAGALLLLSATSVRSRARRGAWVTAVGGSLVAAAYMAVASTPLHTWTRWIPTELQAEYGTEYVSMMFETVHDPVRVAALAVVGVAAVLVAGALLTDPRERSAGGRSEVSS